MKDNSIKARVIFFALFFVCSIANAQTSLVIEREEEIDSTLYVSADTSWVIKLKDYISVDVNGKVHIYGDTINAIRWLHGNQVEAWEEVKEWQWRYFYLMDSVLTIYPKVKSGNSK